jgi:hypothetical protein
MLPLGLPEFLPEVRLALYYDRGSSGSNRSEQCLSVASACGLCEENLGKSDRHVACRVATLGRLGLASKDSKVIDFPFGIINNS